MELCTWIGTTHELGLRFMAGNGEIWTKINNILVKWTEKQGKTSFVDCKFNGWNYYIHLILGHILEVKSLEQGLGWDWDWVFVFQYMTRLGF